VTTQDLEQQIARLQQQYTAHETELLRLRPRVKALTRTLAHLDGALAALRGVLQVEQQAAPAQVPATVPGNGLAPAQIPA